AVTAEENQQSAQAINLLHLPDELLSLIIDYLLKFSDYKVANFVSLQLTCYRLRDVTLAQLRLMNNIKIDPYEESISINIMHGKRTKLRITKYTQDSAFKLISAFEKQLCSVNC